MNAFFTKMRSASGIGQSALGAVLLLGLQWGCKVGLLDLVQLYKALGGGWQDESEKKLARAQTRQGFNEVVKTGNSGFIPKGR